jgi:T5orf172 domain
MTQQIIYTLINEAMPGYIKIGKTTNLEQRIKSLDNTSTALPFECYYACEVDNMNKVEKKLHEAFDDHRVRKNREFFVLSPERVFAILELVQIKNVTPNHLILNDKNDQADDIKALEKAKKRAPVFNFEMVGILPGSILTWFDDDTITCKVLDNRRVEYIGEITSPSASAQKIKKTSYPLQGTIYWAFEGETLAQRYNRYASIEEGEIN